MLAIYTLDGYGYDGRVRCQCMAHGEHRSSVLGGAPWQSGPYCFRARRLRPGSRSLVLGLLVGALLASILAGRNGGGAVATVCVAGFEQSRTRRYLRAFVGATAFIFAFPALKPIFLDPADFGKLTIPGVLGLPALPAALVFAALLIGVIWGLTRLEQRAAGREAEVAG